jgi:hypothetical protein
MRSWTTKVSGYTEPRPESPKPKGQLYKIDFGKYTDEVIRIWNGGPPTSLLESWERRGVKPKYYNAGTMKARYVRIQKLLGYGTTLIGYCRVCNGLNTHLVKYQLDGAVIVERYCSEHLPSGYK